MEREAQMKEKMHKREIGRGAGCVSHSVVSSSLQPHGVYSPTRLLCLRNSPGKNTEVGSHSLLQEVFPTQGSNSHLLHVLHCRTLHPLSHLGSLVHSKWLKSASIDVCVCVRVCVHTRIYQRVLMWVLSIDM